MSVFLSLAKEHQLFQQLLGRLEHCLRYDEKEFHCELRQVLVVLLPALARHEEIEERVFGDPAYRKTPGAQQLLAAVESQHADIERLRGELQELLRTEETYPLAALRPAVFTLCEKLRRHFHVEETRLWPHYSRVMSRSVAHSAAGRARRLVRRLEREIQETWSVASDYVK